MRVEYQDTLIVNGVEIKGDHKTISLPFTHISVRAIILRISDGAILGALHRPDGKYALPGGAIDDGETAEDALIRELDEEKIHLISSDENWRERIGVDYYEGYNELCLWYLFLVGGVEIGEGLRSYPTVAPVLILVGVYMIKGVSGIRWEDLSESIPAFITMIFILFSFRITEGIALGFISYTILKLFAGRVKDIPGLMWLFTVIFILRYIFALV